MENLNVTTAPKTGTFQMRINLEIKEQLENIYARNGLTLTDAINAFLQQSLNVGGIPFLLSDENEQELRLKAYRKLMREIEKGDASGTVDEAEAYRRLGLEL